MTTQTPIELVEKAIREMTGNIYGWEVGCLSKKTFSGTCRMREIPAKEMCSRCQTAETLEEHLKSLTLIRDALKDAEKEIRRMPARTPQIPIWIKREEVLKALGSGEKDV